MDRATAQVWIDRYVRCWQARGTDGLSDLFTADIRYRTSPWREPIAGLDALAAFWDAERDGPDEQFRIESEILAVDGGLAVVRVQVDYERGSSWRDLWLIRLDADGRRCQEFDEWPFAPEQPDGHP
jgi:hypothetical protein